MFLNKGSQQAAAEQLWQKVSQQCAGTNVSRGAFCILGRMVYIWVVDVSDTAAALCGASELSLVCLEEEIQQID